MSARPNPSVRLPARRSRRFAAGGTLLGIFIGLVLGLALAAGVAYYFMRGGNPYQSAYSTAPGKDGARDAGKAARPDASAADRAKADLYRVLPATEEPKSTPRAADRQALEPPPAPAPAPVAAEPAARPGEKFWLQAGSFSTEADAEQLKAQLAFSGWEAVIQPATLPDKAVRYRVRLGPYDNTDELNRIKADLGRRGFEVAVIRN